MIHHGNPSARLREVFSRIQAERMADVPLLNPALTVETVGFRLWQDSWLGVLITPWSMNLLALAGVTPFAPLGAHAVDSLTLPDGAVDFHGAFEPALGHYRQASLFSPMWQFAHQDAARATAEEVMNLLFPAAPAPDLSRRRLFGLRA
ncbi:[NiFe]-hydrogenase assembly chaperone HybE [Rivihabitans pingtungensis]|jgi:[NiFe] hydrogenase assembly HybE family chaperone|uniref:[NiFe] hydrogenase assembly HybE family chaperone n=1 Tax=Rivihabitans pingtungensis TaxID=1054498 RepID=A0A318L279_9NEIS|nr:[NiFe]-hydrogenase assembly chaperone HybE [Rivihabitans pingtungensis]PXX82015.1 [NiFe] hydrogenase assembly HybE family chaperone [Rivihabitans pingtungensis]